jgi:hypothetical protein
MFMTPWTAWTAKGLEYNCVLTKVDWLADCIALRVVGAVLVVFLQLKFAQSFSQWEARADT